jgi:hypothetical protein
MGLGREPGSHVYIWIYSCTLIATLGATVAKERRCGACRRLVLRPIPVNSIHVTGPVTVTVSHARFFRSARAERCFVSFLNCPLFPRGDHGHAPSPASSIGDSTMGLKLE